MGFYDEIKGLYKKDIDPKTGLTFEEKEKLNGLVSLIKETAKNNMKVGKCELAEYFSYRSNSVRNAPGALNNIVFTNNDIYCLGSDQVGRTKLIKETLEEAFGPKFTIQVEITRSMHMTNHLKILMNWPKPEEVV